MGDAPTCEYREWLPDDDEQPTGPVCKQPARWYSCVDYIDQPVCDEHRCRCRKPITTDTTDGRTTMGDIAKRLREEAERRGRLTSTDHGGEAASAFGLRVAANLVEKWEAEAMPAWDKSADGDMPLPEDAAIKAARPTRSGRHDLYQEARRLVGAKRSKFALVDLVNWLLHRVEKAKEDGR